MNTIVKFGQKGKVKKAKAVEVLKLQEYGALAIDAKAALIQELIPLGLMDIVGIIEEEARIHCNHFVFLFFLELRDL